MQFAHPEIFFLFFSFIPLIVWYIFKQRRNYPTLAVSSLLPLRKTRTPFRAHLRHILFLLQLGALGCMIVVLARPQQSEHWKTSSVEGTDIVLAMDVSSSMLAEDFTPNRLEAAKNVASKFVNGRENDNMAIVIFAGESMTGVPLTSDRATLSNYLSSLKVDMVEDGTDIGYGVASAINRIKGGKAKSKSIILLTDGNQTVLNGITPIDAAEIAAEYDIKIYTIGVGTDGYARMYVGDDVFGRPRYERVKVQIDENTLRQMAEMTGGKYYRATDNNVLQEIFNEIDSLEKTELDVRKFTHTEDDYEDWAWGTLGCLLLFVFLRQTYFRTIP